MRGWGCIFWAILSASSKDGLALLKQTCHRKTLLSQTMETAMSIPYQSAFPQKACAHNVLLGFVFLNAAHMCWPRNSWPPTPRDAPGGGSTSRTSRPKLNPRSIVHFTSGASSEANPADEPSRVDLAGVRWRVLACPELVSEPVPVSWPQADDWRDPAGWARLAAGRAVQGSARARELRQSAPGAALDAPKLRPAGWPRSIGRRACMHFCSRLRM